MYTHTPIMYTQTYTCVHTHVYAHTYTCDFTCTYTQLYMYTHTCVCTHTHTRYKCKYAQAFTSSGHWSKGDRKSRPGPVCPQEAWLPKGTSPFPLLLLLGIPLPGETSLAQKGVPSKVGDIDRAVC